MLKNERPGVAPDVSKTFAELKKKGHLVAYVGDVVGTGSSRKSATNSVLWYTGDDIPHVPNKRGGGLCIGNKIAPIFYNTMEDSGALPIEMDVSKMETGDVCELYPYEGIPLIIGRGLTKRAREFLNDKRLLSDVFKLPAGSSNVSRKEKGFTLAQKVVGQACGLEGKFFCPL